MIKKLPIRGFSRLFDSSEDGTLTYSKFIQKTTSIKIPDKYEQDLFSKLINSVEFAPSPEDRHTIEMNKIRQTKIVKTSDFSLQSGDYNSFFKSDPFGTVEAFTYKETKMCIIGACYTHIPPQNIWKLMSVFMPDYILLESRPDDLIDGFRLNLRNPKTKMFSNRMYFDQLLVRQNLNINNKLTDSIMDALNKNLYVPFSEEFRKKFASGLGNKELKKNRYHSTDKVTDETILTASLFSQLRNIPMIISDIPDIVLRDRICVDMSLTDLKEVFRIATENIAKNPDFTPETPLNMAHLSHPESFLFPSDSYTTSLIEYLLHKKRPKKVLLIGGNLQGKSIKALLLNRTVKTIYDDLLVDEIKENLFEHQRIEVLCEKYAIFDVIRYGKRILDEKLNEFPNSMALIQKYSRLDEGNKEYRYLYYLHQQLVKKYLELFLEYYKKGVEDLKHHFYRTIMEKKRDKTFPPPGPAPKDQQ